MARPAIGDYFVGSMAFGATDLAVQTDRILPFSEDIVVATTAGLQLNIGTKGDLERLVNRVANGAACKILRTEMRLMAIGTGWNQTML